LTPQETIRALAAAVKAAVVPHLGTWRARKITGIAASGDTTFDIDVIAENAVEKFLRDHDLNLAYYSEDRGLIPLTSNQEPDGVLIIDPIDGTRSAVAGFEACVVSVAWADYKPAPTLADVRYAAITEIKGGLTFSAERGQGAQIVDAEGHAVTPFLAPTTEIPNMAWTIQAVGAPVDLICQALRDLINTTTVRGGFFLLHSSAFELTRLVTGQLAAVVDVRNRLLKDFPQTRERFREYGGGRLLSLYGYDVAGAARIALEAGCVLTDAWGRDLSGWNLLDTSEPNFGSLIAASNPALHAQILARVNAGFAQLEREIGQN
jgi:myo-inositol-1(or 4)-monophosphatase